MATAQEVGEEVTPGDAVKPDGGYGRGFAVCAKDIGSCLRSVMSLKV